MILKKNKPMGEFIDMDILGKKTPHKNEGLE